MRKLYVIGDSISIQYGPYLQEYLSGILDYSRKSGDPHDLDDPEGANGGSSRQVLDYLKELKQAGTHFDILMLNCGLHDIKRDLRINELSITPDEYAANLSSILELSSELSNDVVWVSTTPVITEIHNSRSVNFHRFAEDVLLINDIAASQLKIPIIDLHSFTLKFGADAFKDHVHYTSEIQKLQAAFIAGALLAYYK